MDPAVVAYAFLPPRPGLIRENPRSYQIVSKGKSFTYADYLKLPEVPGYRHEVLAGVLYREANPTIIHQLIRGRLSRLLWEYFGQIDPRGQVFGVPLVVVLDQETVVQPDILYASGGQRDIFTETHVAGAPTLVVEILSPGSAAKDRVIKLPLYLKAGILHFWVVDSEAKTLECMALQDGQYFMAAAGMENQRVCHPDFAGLEINLGELWRI